MDLAKFTTRSQQALGSAISVAAAAGNPSVALCSRSQRSEPNA